MTLTLAAYVGCYVQSGSRTSSTGLALPHFQATYNASVNVACRQQCISGNYNYFGTVNIATTGADCWCGNAIAYVSATNGLLGLGAITGDAGEQNCWTCNGGGALSQNIAGICGNSTASTIAIYAKGF